MKYLITAMYAYRIGGVGGGGGKDSIGSYFVYNMIY